MKTFNYIILFALFSTLLKSQVIITDDDSTNLTPKTQAILELHSKNNNKGLFMPKVSLTGTNTPNPLPSHIAGMTVYNTNTTTTNALTDVTPGFYYNDGTSWNKLEVHTPNVGDIKYSSVGIDHDGWYLLDGRASSSLPTKALSGATSLGFTSTLPNSADRYLKAKSPSEILGNIGGSSTITLTQANLPNITYNNITTNSTGNHSHTYNDRASGITTSTEIGTTKTVVDNDSKTSTTGSAGEHSHTYRLPLGGSNAPLDLSPKYLSTYIFVYLGQ